MLLLGGFDWLTDHPVFCRALGTQATTRPLVLVGEHVEHSLLPVLQWGGAGVVGTSTVGKSAMVYRNAGGGEGVSG